MKTLTANAITQKNSQGSEPIFLLEIKFSDSLTKYFSDKDITFDGHDYEGKIKDWGNLNSLLGKDTGDITVSDLAIVLENTPFKGNRFSDEFSTNNPENKEATLKLHFVPNQPSDVVIEFKGIIQSPIAYNEYECQLDITDISPKVHKIIERLVNKSDFPNASDESIGKFIPHIYGNVADKSCPAILIHPTSWKYVVACHAAKSIDKVYVNRQQVTSGFSVNCNDTDNNGNPIATIDFSQDPKTLITEEGTVPVRKDVWPISGSGGTNPANVYDKSFDTWGILSSGIMTLTLPTGLSGGEIQNVFMNLHSYDYKKRNPDSVRIRWYKNSSHYGSWKTLNQLLFDETNNIVFISPTKKSSVNNVDGYQLEIENPASDRDYWGRYHPYTLGDGTITKIRGFVEVKKIANVGTHVCWLSTSWVVGNQDTNFTDLDVGEVGIVEKEKTTNLPTFAQLTVDNPSTGSRIQLNPKINHWVNGTILEIIEWWFEITYRPKRWGQSIQRRWEVTTEDNDYLKNWSQLSGCQIQLQWSGSSSGGQILLQEAYFEVHHLGGGGNPDEAIITTDIQGYKDDTSGTYTGTANALIENPSDCIRHFLMAILELDSIYLDTDSFNDARSDLSSAGYIFAGLIHEAINSKDLLRQMAFECRCRFFWEAGKAKIVYRSGTAGSSVKSISGDHIQEDTLAINRSEIEDVRNELHGYYKRNYSIMTGTPGEIFLSLETKTDSTSQGKYGVKVENMELNFLRSQSIISNLLDFYLNRLKDIRRIFTFQTFLLALELERGDIIDITHTLDSLSAQKAEVIGIEHIPGSGRDAEMDTIKITAQEVS